MLPSPPPLSPSSSRPGPRVAAGAPRTRQLAEVKPLPPRSRSPVPSRTAHETDRAAPMRCLSRKSSYRCCKSAFGGIIMYRRSSAIRCLSSWGCRARRSRSGLTTRAQKTSVAADWQAATQQLEGRRRRRISLRCAHARWTRVNVACNVPATEAMVCVYPLRSFL